MQISEYQGPGPDDYANVEALNNAYLCATTGLSLSQRGRLSQAPFLLFSLREDNTDWWRAALSAQRDLTLEVASIDANLRAVQSAGLGFLWQLSRRNAYAARTISGASIDWCEMISGQALVTVLDRVGSRSDLLVDRLQETSEVAAASLAHCGSSHTRVRRASQLKVLQTLLTANNHMHYRPMLAAACKFRARGVAERRVPTANKKL